MCRIVFLTGPTCAGKSGAAIELAGRINAEVISCDSMQVYRGMDIGTAKPSLKERQLIPHHLIDIIDLSREYNAAMYIRDAEKAAGIIRKKGRVPLVAGGSGLYLKAFIDGLFSGPGRDISLRRRFAAKAETEGIEAVYSELKRIDPESAVRINPNDKRRIIRAIEVYYTAGKPVSSLRRQWQERKDAFIIGLTRHRDDLYKRIDRRTEEMFKRGLVEETKELMKHGLGGNKTAKQAVGYKEILLYLESRYTLEETKELIKRKTKNLAKRQLTWFRKDDRVKWIMADRCESSRDIACRMIRLLGKVVSPAA